MHETRSVGSSVAIAAQMNDIGHIVYDHYYHFYTLNTNPRLNKSSETHTSQ